MLADLDRYDILPALIVISTVAFVLLCVTVAITVVFPAI